MSSDSSDDENLELLKEAQDTQFLNETLYSEEKGSDKSKTDEKLASLRKNKDEDEQFNNLKVTPEFQKHVAKHLSTSLDKKLEKNLEYAVKDRIAQKRSKKSGVKLFSNSEKLLKIEKLQETPPDFCRTRYIKSFKTKREIPIKKGEFEAIVVSGEEVLLKKDTKHWSNRTKSSKLFNYRKTNNGTLELLEPQFK